MRTKAVDCRLCTAAYQSSDTKTIKYWFDKYMLNCSIIIMTVYMSLQSSDVMDIQINTPHGLLPTPTL